MTHIFVINIGLVYISSCDFPAVYISSLHQWHFHCHAYKNNLNNKQNKNKNEYIMYYEISYNNHIHKMNYEHPSFIRKFYSIEYLLTQFIL